MNERLKWAAELPTEEFFADFKEQHEAYETNQIIEAGLLHLDNRETPDLKMFILGLGRHLSETETLPQLENKRPLFESNEEWACIRIVSKLHEWYADPVKKERIIGGLSYNETRWWNVYKYVKDDQRIEALRKQAQTASGSLAVS